MTGITNLVIASNANLMKLAQPGETMLELAERIRSNQTPDAAAVELLNIAIAMQSTYEYEEKERTREAQQFKSNTVLGDAATLLSVYEADFDAAVRKLSKANRIGKAAAIKMVEKRIRETNIAAVLPEFAKAEKAIRARYVTAA